MDSGRAFDLLRPCHTSIDAVLGSDSVKETKRRVQRNRLRQRHVVRQCNSHPLGISTHRIPTGTAIYAWRMSIPRFSASGQRLQHRNRRGAGDGIQAIVGWNDPTIGEGRGILTRDSFIVEPDDRGLDARASIARDATTDSFRPASTTDMPGDAPPASAITRARVSEPEPKMRRSTSIITDPASQVFVTTRPHSTSGARAPDDRIGRSPIRKSVKCGSPGSFPALAAAYLNIRILHSKLVIDD